MHLCGRIGSQVSVKLMENENMIWLFRECVGEGAFIVLCLNRTEKRE